MTLFALEALKEAAHHGAVRVVIGAAIITAYLDTASHEVRWACNGAERSETWVDEFLKRSWKQN